jgi:hypothetical protein
MPTVLSALLAPRESARKAFILYINVLIRTLCTYHCANKELKSGSLASHCRSAAATPRLTSGRGF